MDTSYIDYKYTLDLLNRINDLVATDKSLKDFFVYKNYNLWQAYQSSIFSTIKYWSKTKNTDAFIYNTNIWNLAKLFFINVFYLFVSLLSLIYVTLLGRKVFVFSEDITKGPWKNDTRLSPLYKALQSTRTPFIEIIHSIPGIGTITNFLSRKRPAIFLETADMLAFVPTYFKKRSLNATIQNIDLGSFTKDERSFVRWILSEYMSSVLKSKVRYYFLSFIFKVNRTKQFFSIDDFRHYNEILMATQNAGVRSCAIQHGHYTKYHVGCRTMTKLQGIIIKPNKLLVWSSYWQDELLNLGTYFSKDQIVVAGLPQLSQEVSGKRDDGKIGILVPYETDAPKVEISAVANSLLSDENVEVIFKTRSDMSVEDQLTEYGLSKDRKGLTVTTSLSDVLPRTTLALGTYSTLLYDMVFMGIPVGIVETSIDYGMGMVENGLAEFVSRKENMTSFVRHIADLSADELKRRKEKLSGINPKELSETLGGIIKQNG